MPELASTPLLSPKFALALQFANQIHSTQVRKGLGAPYISHLMAVSALVMEFGGTEEQAIAALLHDSAEDCGGQPMLDAVRVMFGEKVAAIVQACTDALESPKPPWPERKQRYLDAMRNKSPDTKLVVCADKLHNLSNTLRDIGAEGIDPWASRMEKSTNGAAGKQLWYFTGCLAALSVGWSNPLLDEFSRAVAQLDKLVTSRGLKS
jgi:(p)ppGpp synthase/HD superfamily hydrolase